MLSVDEIIKKYYPYGSEIYDILITHSCQVRDWALDIIDRHPEYVIDKEFVAEAAMLHDIGIFMCNAPGIKCFGTHEYIEHGYLGADLLREEGLPRHALVCERHTGVGLSLEMILRNNYPIPHRDMLPVSMEEKLICYADKFYSKSRLDVKYSVDRIREKMRRFGESEVIKFDQLHALFA